MTGWRDLANAMPLRPAAERAVGFFALWAVLSGGGADLLPGIVVAPTVAWISLRLLPAGRSRAAPLALLKYALRFLGQSVIAGADVARRALDPVRPLKPGFVSYPVGLPPGAVRRFFTSLMSLLPGTMPVGTDEGGALVIHCLDIEQPVAAQLAAEEALFAQIIARAAGNG